MPSNVSLYVNLSLPQLVALCRLLDNHHSDIVSAGGRLDAEDIALIDYVHERRKTCRGINE